jgi:hypothetical protein
MGARVVVTPGDMTPANFSHPLLVTQKIVPQPAAANEPQTDAPAAVKTDKAADASVTPKPAMSEANLELRSTVGHSDNVKPVMDQPTPLRDQTHTADASGGMAATKAAVTMSDASGGNASPRNEAPASDDKTAAAANTDPKSEQTAKPEADPAAAKPSETASSEDKPVAAKSTEAVTAEIKPATETSDKEVAKADEAPAAVSGEAAKAETAATASVAVETKAIDVKADPSKSEAPKTSEKPDTTAKAVTDSSPSTPANKDAARLLDGEKPAIAKPDPAAQAAPKRSGQIAVFVSRKDSKLYVRQNFAPLFEVPIRIAPSDRPLGTHVFTARVDKDDANVLRWSVVTLPVPARYAERRDDDDRASRRRRIAGSVEMKPIPMPDSPAEALDRLSIPADAMARITEALTTGASIIVSDQGIAAGETGEGTDFIVSLR